MRSLGRHAAVLKDLERLSLSLCSGECYCLTLHSIPHLLAEQQVLVPSEVPHLPGATDLGRQKGIWQSNLDRLGRVKTVVHHLVGK